MPQCRLAWDNQQRRTFLKKVSGINFPNWAITRKQRDLRRNTRQHEQRETVPEQRETASHNSTDLMKVAGFTQFKFT
jgi:hypothetical protein